MVEEYQPLVLVGDTIIEGDVFVSEHGVKAGSIAGYSYNKSQLIYGNIHKSTKQLPEIQTEFDINTIKVLLTDHAAVYIDPQENKTVMNSFKEPVKVIASSDPIRLQSVKLVGNILIHSESEIIVDATASLQDVVLVAPIITVHDNVHGNFQAFAEKNIRIGKGCRLNYPTALVLEEKEENIINESQEETINQISIEKGADIRGIVLFLKETATENTADYKPQIVIEEAATIHGEVYCEQNVELKGTVGGSIFTRGFIANQFGSIYKNHIFNGKILSNDLTHYYAGLFLKDAKPTVAKWIQY
jgi:cytoskeletal protein CcmA (bactofilin family)